MFVVFLACTVPMAVGLAVAASWPQYVTYAGWALFAVVAVARSLFRKSSRRAGQGVIGAGDVYNELYLGRRRYPVTYGSTEKVVAEEQFDRRDELSDGRVTIDVDAERDG